VTALRGIFAAMCTPFDDTGEQVDEGRYTAHIDELIDSGLHGLVLCSGTGEYPYLRDDERTRLIELGAAHVAGRVPTIAQTTALSTADCVDKARRAEDAGASAVMVLPPFLEPPNDRGVLFHYESIAKAVSIPVVMYNVPAQSGVDVTPDLYRRLIAIENLDYIKDSSGDLARLQKLTAVGGGVLCGADPLAPFALMSGAAGMIWGAANFMPHECVQLYDLIDSGRHGEALALWELMRPVCLLLWENDLGVDYLTGVKAAARLTGRDMGPARRPLPPVTGPARTALRMAMARLPVNGVARDRLVWRDWLDERDWLVQSYLRP